MNAVPSLVEETYFFWQKIVLQPTASLVMMSGSPQVMDDSQLRKNALWRYFLLQTLDTSNK